MVLGDPSCDAGLKTKLERAEESAYQHHTHFCHAVGLRIVPSRMLGGDLFIPLALCGGPLDDPLDHCLEGPFVVGPKDHGSVPDPLQILEHRVDDVLVLVLGSTLAWYDMR